MKKHLWLSAVLLPALFLSAHPAHATGIAVNIFTDEYNPASSNCSLREAVQSANLGTDFAGCVYVESAGYAQIQLQSGTYHLTITGSDDINHQGDLDIAADRAVVLNGIADNSTIIDATGLSDRVFDLQATGTSFGGGLFMQNVTVKNGAASDGNGGGAVLVRDGGALYTYKVTFTNNSSTTTGGAVNLVGTTATFWIDTSWLKSNSAQNGGAVAVTGGTEAFQNAISDSTFSANSASVAGGAINLIAGGIDIYASTITANTANQGAGIYTAAATGFRGANLTIASNVASTSGGGLKTSDTTSATFNNSIFANNTASTGPDCNGTIATQSGNNLVRTTTNCLFGGSQIGNITGQDPLLGALTQTSAYAPIMALSVSSPAIDAGDDYSAPTTDERGVQMQKRNLSSTAFADIGAYEYDFAPTVVNITGGGSIYSTNYVYIGLNETERGTWTVTGSCPLNTQNELTLGQASLTLSPLGDGVYSDCYAYMTDDSGHQSNTVAIASFSVDAVVPTLSIVTPITSYGSYARVLVSANKAGIIQTFGPCSATTSLIMAGQSWVFLQGPDGYNSLCQIRLMSTINSLNYSGWISTGTFLIDTTVPTITLLGSPSMSINLDSTFTDPGATATDRTIGTLTSSITVNGSVDIHTAGTYTLTYTVSDTSSNWAVPVTRTVTVKPVIGNVSWSRGASKITTPTGTSVTLKPFGTNFTGTVYARVVRWSKTSVLYVYILTSPTKTWSVKTYNANGKAVSNKFTLPSTYTSKGINVAMAVDPIKNTVLLGLVTKNSAAVPYIYSVKSTGLTKLSVTNKSLKVTGAHIVKFLPLYNGQLVLISAVPNTPKSVEAWVMKSGSTSYTYDKGTIASGAKIVGSTISLR